MWMSFLHQSDCKCLEGTDHSLGLVHSADWQNRGCLFWTQRLRKVRRVAEGHTASIQQVEQVTAQMGPCCPPACQVTAQMGPCCPPACLLSCHRSRGGSPLGSVLSDMCQCLQKSVGELVHAISRPLLFLGSSMLASEALVQHRPWTSSFSKVLSSAPSVCAEPLQQGGLKSMGCTPAGPGFKSRLCHFLAVGLGAAI